MNFTEQKKSTTFAAAFRELSQKLHFYSFVRHIGLEPTRLASPDPKSGAATNYANAAKSVQS